MRLAAGVLALMFAAPAVAQVRDWPSAGGYDITETQDSCMMSADFPIEGRSPIKLAILRHDDVASVLLTSWDWSAKDQAEYSDIRYLVDGYVFTGTSYGFVSGIDKGFSIRLEPDDLDHFARGENLYVERNDAVVANLNLAGSTAAIAVLRRCAAHNAATRAERERREAQVAYLARDPFAPNPTPIEPPGATARDATPRSPVITNPSWARRPEPDFPERAKNMGAESGSVQMECLARPDGSLASCLVLSETPTAMGFGEAALAATRAAQLSPRSIDSLATGGKVRFTQSFRD